MGQPVVFFFPTEGSVDGDQGGTVYAKLYKYDEPSKKDQKLADRTSKREWRHMSKRLKLEYRFKRYPRDEDGKATTGIWTKQVNPNDARFG